MSKEFFIQRDRFKDRREGRSTIYEISCGTCQTPIMVYQKDGKGDLIRCYTNRVFQAKNLKGIEQGKTTNDLTGFSALVCNNCNSLIGTSTVYKPENRPAFNMIRGKFGRKPYKP